MPRKVVLLSCVFLLMVTAAVYGSSFWDNLPETLVLKNDYIAILVNLSEEGMARFSLSTTGGDPTRADDQNKQLLFGQERPRTSYTTVQINGTDYVFGGPSYRRGGRDVRFGALVDGPRIDKNGEAIITTYAFPDALVTQTLSFARSSTTGLEDTARISYQVVNEGQDPIRLGLRIMLDTMLGTNDGAPFRIGDEAIKSDTFYSSDDMPQFWQAFDSLIEPAVMAQGTLSGADITTPDRVYFSNWGDLADGPWDFEFYPGRDFTRAGDWEQDSAMALFWDPVTVGPGEEIEYVTYYGLGGITIAPGELSLGVTAPASVVPSLDEEPFSIVAYIQNTGRTTAKDVVATLELPAGLTLQSGSLQKELGDLPVHDTVQTYWLVKPDPQIAGDKLFFTVRLRSFNTDPNSVTRGITVIPPPRLKVEAQPPRLVGFSGGVGLYEVVVSVTNNGGFVANNVWVDFTGPTLQLANKETKEKYLGNLTPGESVSLSWFVRPNLAYKAKDDQGKIRYFYSFVGRASNATNATLSGRLYVEDLLPKVYVNSCEEVAPGDFVTVEVMADDIGSFFGGRVSVTYDPTMLSLLPGGVERGTLFTDVSEGGRTPLHWAVLKNNIVDGVVSIEGDRSPLGAIGNTSGSLVRLRFIAVGTGTTKIAVEEVKVIDGAGNPVDVLALPQTITMVPVN
ncbi:MAG: cellulosome anchor protein [Limnochordia bacterium]|nr:cellulosome anchor protein [Limnochordia bacterium]